MRNPLRVVTLAVVLATLAFGAAVPGNLANPEPARAATTVEICGKVNVYVKPTLLLAGALTVGAVPFVITAGTSVPAAVQVGANVCLRLTLNAAGNITDIVAVNATATSTVKLCGEVTAYVAATATKTGRLTIGGRDFVIAYGADLPAAFKVGADLCVTLDLNAFGQVKSGSATANATATVKLCGEVTAFAAATATKNGRLTIGGRDFVIAAGTTLPAAFKLGRRLRYH